MVSLLFLFISASISGIVLKKTTFAYVMILLSFLLGIFLLFHHVDFGSLNIDL